MAQPKPHAGIQDVTPQVVADIQARTLEGIKKYGRPLQTHNGRNALQDAYEEALDLCQYLKQALMEKSGQDRTQIDNACGRSGFYRIQIASPVVCCGCRKLIQATEFDRVEVIADTADEAIGFFCSAACGNIPVEKIGPWAPALSMPSEMETEDREHRDGGPAMKPNGYHSQLMRSCADCGQNYDLLWPKGCKGKRPVAPRGLQDGR